MAVNVLITCTRLPCTGSDFTFISKFHMVVGHLVAQLVEALRCKAEGHRFDSQWCHWNFSLT